MWARGSPFRVAVAAAAWLVAGSGVASADPLFKIYVEHAAVYEVDYDRLREAGLDGEVASAGVGLSSFGTRVPVWIEDGGDGRFGPGDRLLFVGEVLRGEVSYFDPYSRFNCYLLDLDDPQPWQGESRLASGGSSGEPAALVVRHRLEPDRVMVRFRARRGELEESWYWRRLSVVDKEPFRYDLEIEGLVRERSPVTDSMAFADALAELVRQSPTDGEEDGDRVRSRIEPVFRAIASTSTAVRLRFGFRGWSEPRHVEARELSHHEVEIHLNGVVVSRAAWDGRDHFVHEIEVPSDRFVDGANELALVVPKRTYPQSGDLLVDVVLLNWIELEHPHVAVVGPRQLRLHPDPDDGPARVEVRAEDDGPVDLFLPSGLRWRSAGGLLAEDVEVDDGGLFLARPGAAAVPDELVLDRPSRLATDEHRADYIMIAHRSLLAGAERLADFHRGRGLTVAVVDVQDVYDDFNHGVLHPRAIKDFLEHARSRWQPPAPRFVLLVGDASWDFKNPTADDSNYADWTYRPGEGRSFVKNASTPYAEGAELNHRNLVPTSSYTTLEGHAASDTWFVCFDDGDNLPDMAIGRLPVVSPEELDHVIDKTIAFAEQRSVGPWRRNLLFIANESVSFQRRSDLVAESFSARGYVPTKIYPHPSEPANEHHTQRILEAFDEGVLAVHFIGHGGRYIWRTGPPDLEKNHDLFTLDHLDELAANRHLPVVLSLTCYSAPFDHPTADSIGEKLLRIPDRGAIAVFAASWRNSPSPVMGQTLLDELTTPGSTVGEAVMRAKHEFRNDVLVQTYNLLGDPAIPVAAPELVLDLDLDEGTDGFELQVGVPAAVADGRLMVDWVGEDGSTLRSDVVAVRGGGARLELAAAEAGGGLAGVRAYAWDAVAGVDGIGWLAAGTADTDGDEDAGLARSESEATRRGK